MQRLHFGPSKEKETSRHQAVSKAKRRQLQPPPHQPCGMDAGLLPWLVGNDVLQNLLGLV